MHEAAPITVAIGEFSRWTHLSVKALRHYHEVGVLLPAAIDPITGYRRYAVEQLGDAQLVRRLRELDVPLDDIRTVLTANDGDRQRVLAAHVDRLEHQVSRTQSVVSSLRRMIDASPARQEIVVRRLEVLPVMMERATVGIDAIEAWSVVTFERLAARAGSAVVGSGSLFASRFFTDGRGEVTAFVGVAEPDLPGASELLGGTFAAILHEGPYADLDLSYGAVGAHVASYLPLCAGPIREHYLVGPGDTPDPYAYRTEVLWPLEPDFSESGRGERRRA